MKSYNKASVTVLAGALVTIIAAFVEIDSNVQGAIHTVLTALLVAVVPNGTKGAKDE